MPPGQEPPPPVEDGGGIDATTRFAVRSGAVDLQARFDPGRGALELTGLTAYGLEWAPVDLPHPGWLSIDGVVVEDEPAVALDGSTGLELLSAGESSAAVLHQSTGLQVDLEFDPAGRGAIVHRLALANAREAGAIRIAAAATLSLPLRAGDLIEVLRTDDAPGEWSVARGALPVSYGHHGLRSGESGVYPLVRLETFDGKGIIVGVSSATSWRVDVGLEDWLRTIRAGEGQSDLTLQPGQRVQLPDVVTIFYQGGSSGAVEALRRYLAASSLAPPQGWRELPPAVFNTWFGYGTGLLDDGSKDSPLRQAARTAAEAGLEVFVVDAGWYVGNPLPERVARSRRSKNRQRPDEEDGDPADGVRPAAVEETTDDFDSGLGAWVENPRKWLARPGEGGSPHAGLRNFSDYVHGLSVRRAGGGSAGRMRFGLWFEPERFDPNFDHPERVPSQWAIPGRSILDLSRPEVVNGIAGRIQRAIDEYQVDYIKVDSNRGLWAGVDGAPNGHFWTRWSEGFEQLLVSLRRANRELYIEHCAGGLKRYWIGLARVAHGCWLDDDVRVQNVGALLDATDGLLLPRQKHVLVTEDLATLRGSVGPLLAEYAGTGRRNGGAIGFSSRLDEWSGAERQAAADAIDAWKSVRP